MAYTTINKSTDYFNTKLYTGNGSTNTAQTGVGFQPDWTWIKERSSTSSHILTDAVRGANKSLSSNLSGGQSTETQSLMSFDSDGFTVGSGGGVNENSQTYASWNWKANGQGSSNTDGTINTTYTSANTTSGMSIIKYSGNGSAGATIGHGLGVAPRCVIIKRTDTTSNWIFGTGATGFTKFLYLNTSGAETTNSGAFNNTAPSNSVITLGSWNDVNNSSGTYIAYAFAEKQGFSKFGTYTGNATSDNAFVYTGFKPAWIMTKKTAGSGYHWFIFDNKRLGYNDANKRFEASSSNAEANTSPAGQIDILSNGFKIRTTDGHIADAGEYLYIAFAEAPLVGSNNVPATAR